MSYVAAAGRAITAAGHAVVDMADFPDAERVPARVCADRVRGCDVYVGLLGTRYGTPVRDMPEVSYPELAFDTATDIGLPRLMFLLDTDGGDLGIPPAQLIDREFGARQEAFRRRVQDSGLLTRTFADPATLGQLVERALRELDARRRPAQALGSAPVWGSPARNPGFTGREDLLATVRERLTAGDRATVQALHGMAGAGKTQLATEYAHRFAGDYDLVWWVDCAEPARIGGQLAALGAALGYVQSGAATEEARSAVLAGLRARGGWLLVFDGAQSPADITPWLPGGGHVLITTRAPGWAEIAATVEVDMLPREDSVAILTARVPWLARADADQLAAELGDLPLAVAQAVGYMNDSGMPAADYLSLLRTRAGELLDRGVPGSYPRSLAATIRLIADRLDREAPQAGQLASLCAFLAPEPIPADLLTGAAAELPIELATLAADSLAWRQALAGLTRQSLARVDGRALQLHRLTQAILRDRLAPEQADATRERSEAILAANGARDDPADPVTWPRWAGLLPHLMAADLAGTTSARLRWTACHACHYLLARGDTRAGLDLAEALYRPWRGRLGDDDRTLAAATAYLAVGLRTMGHYAEARDLDAEILDRRRRELGPDHPSTLSAVHNLASDLRELGEVQSARELDEATLEGRHRALGPEHPSALQSRTSIASDARDLGDLQTARALDEDALDRKRRVLGPDHPSTLISAGNLAIDLRLDGQLQAARDLDQDTLARKRRVLGPDHPSTLVSAGNLAIDLRLLGEVQAARELDERTLAQRRRVLGEDHPHTRQSADNLAADLRLLGEPGDAA